jgi:hypothetical protein
MSPYVRDVAPVGGSRLALHRGPDGTHRSYYAPEALLEVASGFGSETAHRRLERCAFYRTHI